MGLASSANPENRIYFHHASGGGLVDRAHNILEEVIGELSDELGRLQRQTGGHISATSQESINRQIERIETALPGLEKDHLCTNFFVRNPDSSHTNAASAAGLTQDSKSKPALEEHGKKSVNRILRDLR